MKNFVSNTHKTSLRSEMMKNQNFFPFDERNFLKKFSDYFWCVLSVCGVFSILGPRPLEKNFLKFPMIFFSKIFFSHQTQNHWFGQTLLLSKRFVVDWLLKPLKYVKTLTFFPFESGTFWKIFLTFFDVFFPSVEFSAS